MAPKRRTSRLTAALAARDATRKAMIQHTVERVAIRPVQVARKWHLPVLPKMSNTLNFQGALREVVRDTLNGYREKMESITA
ncbi:hypothetical protein Tco_0327454 [Tanacetum coccineum]|uniref:Uncharacterized protein n=1 Tax=Tanacetum coccineum TaxID=301880 RepID=A0ABQ5IKI2_9ASTR